MAAFWPAGLVADVVELSNGDTLSGKVIAVDEKTVKIQNDVLGEITLPREKVAALILGERPRGRVAPKVKPGAEGEERPADWWRKYGETPEEIVENLAPKDFGPGRVEQLERGAPRYGTPEEAGSNFVIKASPFTLLVSKASSSGKPVGTFAAPKTGPVTPVM